MRKSFTSAIVGLCCFTALAAHSQTLVESQQDFIQTKVPEKLTWKNFDAVAKYASQNEQELRYQQVKWENSVLEAQQRAFKADKPIMMILFFGDHRVNC